MTGWPLGLLTFLIDKFYKIHSFNSICPSTISQYASVAALTQGAHTEEVLAMKNGYKLRKRLAYQRIVEMDLEVVEPKGAFIFFLLL